jgi:uncharacterized protein (TIGR00730 family)
MIDSICVFCGSRYGADGRYRAMAGRLGSLAGDAGLTVVYGGGHVGLMGALADAAMAADGRVIGYIPARLLELEVGHRAITELIVTKDMYARKAQMIDRADAFVVLPGGLGTLDELLEVVTLRQLGYHDKPIVLVSPEGYWDPLLALVDKVIEQEFAAAAVRRLYQVVDAIDQVLPALGIGVSDQPALHAAEAD